MSNSGENLSPFPLAAKKQWVFVNGEYKESSSAVLSVHDRSIMYGDAIYTTLKVRNSLPVFLVAHLHRLRLDGSRLRFGEVIFDFSISKVIQELISLNEIASGYVRITISRGTRLEFPSLHTVAPACVIVAGEANFSSTRSEFSVITLPEGRDQFRDAKTTNRIVALHALATAFEQKAQEAIFTDQSNLIEATCYNLIESREGELFTPNLQQRGLAGIVRHVLLNEANLMISDICSDTVGPLYLTNCLAGVQPVSHLNGKELKVDANELSRLRHILDMAELQSMASIEID